MSEIQCKLILKVDIEYSNCTFNPFNSHLQINYIFYLKHFCRLHSYLEQLKPVVKMNIKMTVNDIVVCKTDILIFNTFEATQNVLKAVESFQSFQNLVGAFDFFLLILKVLDCFRGNWKLQTVLEVIGCFQTALESYAFTLF